MSSLSVWNTATFQQSEVTEQFTMLKNLRETASDEDHYCYVTSAS